MAEVTIVETKNGVFSRILETLRFIAGDPQFSERAIFLSDSTPVTDAALVTIPNAIDESQVWSSMVLQFTESSGTGRYNITGLAPTAAGRGFQIPSGGGTLTIIGAWNIRNFQVIAETGQTLEFTAMLFKASMWARERGV